MVKKIGNRDFLAKVLSLLIAIVLWFYVSYAENPVMEIWFDGVSLTYVGDTSLAEQGLVRNTENEVSNVSLKVHGNRTSILALSSHDITASVDLSGITSATTYSLPIQARFPESGLTVVDKKPYNISVTVDELTTRELHVETELVGNADPSAAVTGVSSSVSKVTVTGAASVMKNALCCVAQTNIEGITAKKSMPVAIALKLADGTLCNDTSLSYSNTYTTVTINVDSTVSVPVRAVISNQNEAKIKSVKITPEEIRITGDNSAISAVQEIQTAPITLSRSFATETVDAQLVLPEGVRTSDGSTSVSIEFTIEKESVLGNGR